MRIRFYRCLYGVAGLTLAVACGGNAAQDGSTPSAATTSNAPATGTAAAPGAAGTTQAPGAAAGVVSAPGATTAGRTAGTSAAGVPGTSAASGSGATTAGTSAAAAGGTAVPTSNNGVRDAGENFVSGTWHGYVFAKAEGMGSTVMPMDFKMQTTGMPRCIKGSVAATMDYSGVALLGFGLNEDGGTKMTVTPTKGGVNLEVKMNTASPLRFQVEGPSGTEDTRWCVDITGTGGFIPWSSLKTKCWGADGVAYKNEPIVSAMLIVPGSNTAAVAYDFCVNTLAEADGSTGAAAAGSGGMTGAAGSSTPQTGGAGAGGSTSAGNMQGGCNGYATGYWDCCKPHCGWKDKVPGANPLLSCDKSDNSLGTNYDAQSACNGGNAYQCQNLSPWAVNDKLAYGYAAVAASAQTDICGKCYQLQFTGQSFNSEPDPGSTSMAGKTMIVQAINIGSDVSNGQFDLLIPGRGVGMFDACSSQWGVNKADLGETYGGFLLACQRQAGRQNHAAVKSCVMQSCMNVFEAHGLSELAAGCKWFIDWFQVADNPRVQYKEVACPSELNAKGITRNAAPGNMCLK